MTDFTHDVAISSVSFDALLLTELSEWIVRRAGPSLFWRTQRDDAAVDPEADRAALSVLAESARVVVVLHQRLWGRDGRTVEDALALRRRVKARRQKSICVVMLDDAPLPSWLEMSIRCTMADVGFDAAAKLVLARIAKAGGPVAAAPVASPPVTEPVRPAWSDGQQVFMAQPRAQTAFKREFEALTMELAERTKTESDRLGEDQVVMHCAPQRLVVQLGRVGLSMSWVAGRSGNLADGRLLVIEWDGAITHQRHIGGAKTASPTREQLYRAEAKGPDDWRWRPESGDGSSYSSRNLAGQCFSSANMGRAE